MHVDHRRYPRTARREQTIYHCEVDHAYETDRMHYLGTIIDISSGGVGIQASTPHQVGQQLWFEAVEGTDRVEKPAIVRWCREPDNGDGYEIGVEFY